jgi:hypothetical protein
MVVQDLWAGADVCWQGPETTRKGVRLRPGDRAVVTDAGRHHITSFGSLYYRAGTRPPRPRRGVRIRLASGDEVTVPRKHLELVPPDHPLAPEPDGTQAEWWLEQLEPWGEQGLPVSSLVPPSLPAVCQVLHPWWGAGPEPISRRTSRGGFLIFRRAGEPGSRAKLTRRCSGTSAQPHVRTRASRPPGRHDRPPASAGLAPR